ncbi:MAG: hypothetical protein M3481_03945 [Actinomycetota bacterium]|nr:hypothetical protein [Actinomycetota bacterium]
MVREHALRAMDAWHLSVASLTIPGLAEPGEEIGLLPATKPKPPSPWVLGFERV